MLNDVDRKLGHLLRFGSGGGEGPADVGECLAGLSGQVAWTDEVALTSSATCPATNTSRLPVAAATWL